MSTTKPAAAKPAAPTPPAATPTPVVETRSDAERLASARAERLEAQRAADKKAGLVAGSPVLHGQAENHFVETPPSGPAPLPSSFPPAAEYEPGDYSPDLTGAGANLESLGSTDGHVAAAQLGASTPPRNPDSRTPAVPGAWPVPEDQLPAVAQLDHRAVEDAGGFEELFGKSGSLLVLDDADAAAAVSMYRSTRAQFPQHTLAQLNEEFRLRWDSRVGGAQSARAGEELSTAGATAVGDFREASPVPLAELREDVEPPAPRPRLTLAQIAEPALVATDDAKSGDGPVNAESQV